MKHNIYIITTTKDGYDRIGYDCYDAHVVIADTSKEARQMCPSGEKYSFGQYWHMDGIEESRVIGNIYENPELIE